MVFLAAIADGTNVFLAATEKADGSKDVLATAGCGVGEGAPRLGAGTIVKALFEPVDGVYGLRPSGVRWLWLRGPDRRRRGMPGGERVEERDKGLLGDGGIHG